jgi:hypothetical protein
MKRLYSLMASAVICGAMVVNAQSPQLSLGADLGLPIGDFGDVSSLVVGPAVGFELPVGDNIGITAQVAYHFVMLKDGAGDFFDRYNMIPAQVGLKYYFMDQQEGFYGHGQFGIHTVSIKTADIDLGPLGTIEGVSDSNTNLSWAIGAGYQMEKLDIGLRFNSIMPDSDAPDGATSSSYIGLRVAYLLGF